MKKMKKILTLLLTVCLLLPCFSTVSQAASGVIFFDDLSTTVGATFTIKGTVVTRNDVLGSATVQMTYDAEYLRFISGDGVTKNSAGSLTYSGSGNGSSDRVEFTMTFQALKEGNTRMDQGSATVTNKSGSTVSCDKGYSDVKIGPGDPSLIQPEQEETAGSVSEGETKGLVIKGVQYTPSAAFADNTVPSGFTTAEVTYNGTAYTGIEHSLTGVQGLYLMNPSGKADFYLYNPAKDIFYPCEEIMISDEYSLVVLNDVEDVTLGDEYIEANISINETEFPAWYNPENDGFFVIYAIGNATGEKSLYLYDSVEHTYQRMEMPVIEEPVVVEEDMMTKITNFVVANLIWIGVGVACTLVVFIILLITLAVKLSHRNSELDDLYDEYQIDVEGVEPVAPARQNIQVELVESEQNQYSEENLEDALEELDEEYEEEYDEDDFDEDDYEEEYEDDYCEEDLEEADVETSGDDFFEEMDDLADLRREISHSDVKSSKNYSEFYDDDDFIEDEQDERAGLKQSVNTDTFEMDFIDLD